MIEGKISSQNLIKQVNPEAPSKNAGYYKPIVFDALSVLAAFGLGYVYMCYLAGMASITTLILAITGYGLLATLQMFFTPTLGHRFMILLLEVVALFGLFYNNDVKILAIAAGLVLIFSYWGDISAKLELENGLEIRFFQTSIKFLKKFTTAIILGLVILYLPKWDQNHLFVSEQNFQKFFSWSAGFITTAYPQVDVNGTFDVFAQGVAQTELQNDQRFKDMTPVNQATAVRDAAEQFATAVTKEFGITIQPNETASKVFYDSILAQLINVKQRANGWFSVVWVSIVFLVLRSVGIIFYLVLSLIAFIVYQILLAAGFIHVIGESRTHEVISY